MSITTLLAISSLASATPKMSMRSVVGLEPGLWSIATSGMIHVLGYSEPFSKDLQQCIEPDKETRAILPSGKGECEKHETTIDGVMHWHMMCHSSGTQTRYDFSVKTVKRRFSAQGKIVSSRPNSTTEYTARGHWLKATCQ